MDSHTRLWQQLGAKDPAKGYGAIALGKQWGWYEKWLDRVREECVQHPELYQGLLWEPEQDGRTRVGR